MTLTPKQGIFADECLIDLSAIRAYKVAYPSCKKDEVATVNGSRLLRNTKVTEYTQERMRDWEKRTETTQDWVLEKLWETVSANGTDFAHVVRESVIRNNSYAMDPDTGQMQTRDVVRIVSIGELPEEKRAVISAIEEAKFEINVKTYGRVRALKLLGRHLGMLKDKVELPGGLDIKKTKLDDLLQQIRGGD